jgi:hypothetical protein
MISRKRFNKEKLFSSTLLETLLIFLFILLAIASIYNKKLKYYNNAIVLGSNEVAIDKDKLKSIQDSLTLYRSEDGDNTIIIDTTEGVMPPSCILDNGNQRLLEIQFSPDTTFLIKVINLVNQIIITKDYTLINDQLMTLNINQFRRLGSQLHESRRIHIDHRRCNPKINKDYYTDPYCYECLYVVVIKNKIVEFKDVSRKLTLRRLLPLKNVFDDKSDVPMNEVLYMSAIVGQYFSPIVDSNK